MAYVRNAIDNGPDTGYYEVILMSGKESQMTPKEEKSALTAEWLRANMVYEPETGVFLWRVRGPGRMMGKVLGTTVWPGYRSMKVDGVLYYAHRLAWLYVHGEWPSASIDHRDGNKGNNAISNLRIATHSQNAAGKKTARRVAPARGVMPHGVGFVARLYHGGKRHYLGYHSTLEAAKAAYEAKAKEIHGEFAHREPVDHVAAAVRRSPHRDWLLVATPGFGA